MTVYAYDFENGVNGNDVNAADPTPDFDLICGAGSGGSSGKLKYSNAEVGSGSTLSGETLGAVILGGSGDSGWTSAVIGTGNVYHYSRIEIFQPSGSTGNTRGMLAFGPDWWNGCSLLLAGDGTLLVKYGSNVSSTSIVIAQDQWVRIEIYVKHDATTGEFELRYYDTLTAPVGSYTSRIGPVTGVETRTGLTNAYAERYTFGHQGGEVYSGDIYYDNWETEGNSDGSGLTWLGPVTPSAPTADFHGTPTTFEVDETCSFTDDSTGSPTSWAWFKDDGSGEVPFSGTPTAQNPTESFTAGTWTIRLEATNAGGTDSKTRTDYLTVLPLDIPVASFTDVQSPQMSVVFTDTSTTDPSDPILTWHWQKNDSSGWVDFDGTPTIQNPTEIFSEGTWAVRLTVTNEDGSSTVTMSDHVVVSTGGSGGIVVRTFAKRR